MNVRLYDRGVDPKLLTIFQPNLYRRFHHQVIDGLERLRSQSVKGTVERAVLRHWLAVEIRELAQGVAVGNPLAQFAIIPVFDAHENQRTQHLARRQAAATSLRILQTSFQITPYGLNHFCVVVQKIRDALQHRFQLDALLHELPIGETDLLGRPGHVSVRSYPFDWSRSRFRAWT